MFTRLGPFAAVRLSAILLVASLLAVSVSQTAQASTTIESNIASPALASPGLQVFIEPAEARTAGAQWRCRIEGAGWTEWHDSGYTESLYIEPYWDHEIEFSDVSGWQKPSNVIVHIDDSLVTVTRTYTYGGSLKVNISPAAAVTAGAKWRRVGTMTWRNSGETESSIPAGTYTVEFKPISGWDAPTNKTFVITTGQTKTYTAVYSQQPGSLTVNINPVTVRSEGARWSLAGVSGSHASGETVQLAGGSYTVVFSSIRGWVPPEPVAVNIAGDATTLTRTYSRLDVGNIRVFADSYTTNGATVNASGNVTLAFYYGTAAPEASPAAWTSDLIKVTGTVTADTSARTITGTGTFFVKTNIIPIIGLLPIYSGSYTINGQAMEITNLHSVFEPIYKFIGFDIQLNSLKFLTNPFGIRLNCELVLPAWIFGDDSFVNVPKLELKSDGHITVVGSISITDMSLFKGIMTLEGLYGFINTETTSFGITVDKLSISELPTIGGSLIIQNKKLKEISGAAYDLNVQIPSTPIYFQDIGLKLEDPSPDQTRISLTTIAFTLFERQDGFSIMEASASGTIDFRGALYVAAAMSIFGYEMMSASLDIWFDGWLLGSAKIVRPALLLTVCGTLYVNWYNPNSVFWNIVCGGYIGFDLPGWIIDIIKFFDPGFDRTTLYLAEGWLWAPDNGITCAAEILGFIDFQFTIPPFWESNTPIKASVKGLKTARIGGTSPTAASNFAVPQACPTAVFVVEGEQAAPEIKLKSPDGTVYDTKRNLPKNSNSFVFLRNEDENRASFFIRNPAAGNWQVVITNPGQAGDSDVYFVGGNNAPSIIPGTIENLGGNSFRLNARAYDPDETATVTFYWAKNDTDFNGMAIGSVKESDGKLSYVWEPSEEYPFKTGYIYAEIRDSKGSIKNAFFSGKITIGEFVNKAPKFGKCKIKNDNVLTKVKNLPKDGVDSIRVYYSDDLKQKVLTDYVDVPAEKEVKLSYGDLKPGRSYQLRMTFVSDSGAESPMSKRRTFKYIAKSHNNWPYFTSEPRTETSVGANYVYNLAAFDADSDALQYTLEEAPEGMALSGDSLTWTPVKKNAGLNFVTLKVSDGKGGEETQQFSLMVASASVPTQKATVDVIDTNEGRLLIVSVRDRQAGKHRTLRDKLMVTIARRGGFDQLKLNLTETAGDSGIFQGTLLLDDNDVSAPAWLASVGSSTVETQLNWKDRAGKPRGARSVVRSY